MTLTKKSFRNSLILEYGFILATILIGYVLLPSMMEQSTAGNPGIDGLGNALAWVILIRAARAILAFFFFVVNPIRIMIKYRTEFKEMAPVLKKFGTVLLIGLPILLSVFIILEVPIANFIYHLKYETAKGSYEATAENYKTPADFREELKKRDLLFDADKDQALLDRLNEKYTFSDRFKYYYYTAGEMMALSSDTYYDTVDYNCFVAEDSSEKAPYYMYNAILTMPSKDEKLQYAPIARYDGQDSVSDNDYPFFRDCYIECKILYVDGDVYAIIGVGNCYDLRPQFKAKNDPYVCILAEKDTITTYKNGKYYPDGSIEDQSGQFVTYQNTKHESSVFSNFPVRKVDHLDRETISAVAAELQEGLLKEKIDAHWSK